MNKILVIATVLTCLCLTFLAAQESASTLSADSGSTSAPFIVKDSKGATRVSITVDEAGGLHFFLRGRSGDEIFSVQEEGDLSLIRIGSAEVGGVTITNGEFGPTLLLQQEGAGVMAGFIPEGESWRPILGLTGGGQGTGVQITVPDKGERSKASWAKLSEL